MLKETIEKLTEQRDENYKKTTEKINNLLVVFVRKWLYGKEATLNFYYDKPCLVFTSVFDFAYLHNITLFVGKDLELFSNEDHIGVTCTSVDSLDRQVSIILEFIKENNIKIISADVNDHISKYKNLLEYYTIVKDKLQLEGL